MSIEFIPAKDLPVDESGNVNALGVNTETGELVRVEGGIGGGGGRFVITVGELGADAGLYPLDKTMAEIEAAYAAGMSLVLYHPQSVFGPAEIALSLRSADSGLAMYLFSVLMMTDSMMYITAAVADLLGDGSAWAQIMEGGS